jgi:flagellar basal-body rod protein FlgG
MNGAFYIGATGLHAQERALDVIANNIANMNTPAFKRSQVRFSELVGPGRGQLDAALLPADSSTALSGVALDSTARVFAQGELKQTGSPLDIAVSGDGFIELMGPAGQELLWRGGTLKVNEDGNLANAEGLTLKAMISVPRGATGIAIAQDGKVTAQLAGQTEAVQIGRIELAMPKDVTTLSALDGGLYQIADASDLISVTPGEEGGGVFVQGSLETSNVQLSDEMVTMLLMQRAYAANAQIVQAGDQLMSIANGLKR